MPPYGVARLKLACTEEAYWSEFYLYFTVTEFCPADPTVNRKDASGLVQLSDSSFRKYGYLLECQPKSPPVVPMKFDEPGRFNTLFHTITKYMASKCL